MSGIQHTCPPSPTTTHAASNSDLTVVPWLTSIIMAAQDGCDRLGGLYEKDRTLLNATD